MKTSKGLKDHNPSVSLLNKKKVKEALFECIVDNDPESFVEIMEGYISAKKLSDAKFAKIANISPTTLSSIKSRKKISFDALSKLVNAMVA